MRLAPDGFKPFGAFLDHLMINVGRPHLSGLSDHFAETNRHIASAGSNIQHFLTFGCTGKRDAGTFPHTVQPETQNIVHQVIALGYRLENFFDVFFLFAFGHGAVAKVHLLFGIGRLFLIFFCHVSYPCCLDGHVALGLGMNGTLAGSAGSRLAPASLS